MNILRKIGVLAALAIGLSGCATNGGGHYENWRNCALTGAVTGGVGVGLIEDDAAVASAVVGAIIGGVICARRDADGDGVRNSKDNCPGTAIGARVDAVGCELEVPAPCQCQATLMVTVLSTLRMPAPIRVAVP